MRVLLVQSDIVWESGDANRDRLSAMLAACPPMPGDLIVLPEMHNTGFSMNIEKTCADAGAARAFLRDTARTHAAFTVASLTVPDGVKRNDAGEVMGRNRAMVHDPRGDVACEYDKVHPFSYGAEAAHIVGGDRLGFFEWRARDAADAPALRCCPLVCYDLRFPELFRSGLDEGAQMFVVVANWPEARASHWRALLVARAIENQAFVVGVNRAGRDPSLAYAGGSMVVGPRGEVLAELDAREQASAVEIDADEVRRWRDKFPAWRDRRWAGLNHARRG